jgi:hypothetical protein
MGIGEAQLKVVRDRIQGVERDLRMDEMTHNHG